jgi:hypothetical protein
MGARVSATTARVVVAASFVTCVAWVVLDVGRVVGDSLRSSVEIIHLEVGVALKAPVSIKFNHLCKCLVAFKEIHRAVSMDGVVGFLRHGTQEPVDLLLLREQFRGVVVGQLATNPFELVHVTRDWGSVDVADRFYELVEGSLTLLGEALVASK